MGDLVAGIFTDDGPVAFCPECEGILWYVRLNKFGYQWDKIIGTECMNCGFLVDWISAERVEEDKDYAI